MPHMHPSPLRISRAGILALAVAAALLAGVAGHAAAQDKDAGPADACTDFHAFANADWLAANAPAATPVTALAQLEARAVAQQHELLDAAMRTPQGPLQSLLGDFWASGLDEAAIERAGAQPIAPLLERIAGIRRERDIAPAIAALHQAGIPVLFDFGADLDGAGGDSYIGYFGQGGLGLPDPAFYTRDDAATAAMLARYRDYVRKILVLAGVPAEQAAAQAQVVVDIETRIAQASRPLSLLRDADSRHAPVAVAGLGQQYPRLALEKFLQAQAVDAANVSLANPQLFAALDGMVGELEPEQWRAYLRFHLGNAMAPHLSKAWRDAHFAFHGAALRGQTMPALRAGQVLATLNRIGGPILGHEYAARFVPAATAARAQEIATRVRDALDRGIDRNAWMSPQAKAEAKAKLAALRIGIGTPQHAYDFGLAPLDRASYGGNVLALAAWRQREETRRIGNAAAGRRWPVLPQQPMLALDPAGNRLLVTAAMLQAPVLDMSQDVAAQYGAFGALVGHELSHGFDAQGRLVDAGGALRDWWTPADASAWDARMAQLTAQYVSFPIPTPPGVAFDPRRIEAENAADLAGVELALDAFATAQAAADVPAQQAFYGAWSRLWAQQLSPQQIRQRAASDVHAPGYWRSNGPLRNQPGFAEAFSCKEGTPMHQPEDERVSFWR